MSSEREPTDARWIVAFDASGKDLALEAELAAMSDEDRKRTEENVRDFIESVRATLRPRSRWSSLPRSIRRPCSACAKKGRYPDCPASWYACSCELVTVQVHVRCPEGLTDVPVSPNGVCPPL